MALLLTAGLLAALALGLGFWGWRRLVRTASLETAARPAAAVLGAAGPQLASSDDEVAKGSLRPSVDRKTLSTSSNAVTAAPAEPAPSGVGTASPTRASCEEEAPDHEDLLQEPPQPLEPSIPIRASFPSSEDTTVVAVPTFDRGGTNSAGQVPPARTDNNEPAPEAAAQATAAAPERAGTIAADEEESASTPKVQPPEQSIPDAPWAEDAAAIAKRSFDVDGMETAGQVPLPPPNDGERPPDGTSAPCTDPVADEGAATALNPNGAAGEPRDASTERENDAGVCREESCPTKAPDPRDVPPVAESRCDATNSPSSAAAEFGPQSVFHVASESGSDPAPDSNSEAPAAPAFRPRQPAVHRDRRGKRRTLAAAAPSRPGPNPPGASARPPAEAKLRLSLHPIRRTARLSVVLTRPDGFPPRVTVLAGGSDAVEAYDEQRYDDLDLPWTSGLLDSELRLTSTDGFQWLRSARQVHIFAQDPNEPELISASAARAGVTHTLVCRSRDAEAIILAAASTGSPALQTHDHWQGIPDGWTVLSGYTPAHAAIAPLPAALRTLDPGEGLEISFDGGLTVRGRVYAAGHPPRIIITPAPGNASVTIGGEPAELSSDGAWTAPGWDRPGQHIVDVVPGPSVSYEIAADPWLSGGWDFWDAHPQRFGAGAGEPWARARICGALVRGPADETVFAAETRPTLVALGARSGATPLRRRPDAGVSVGFSAEPPAFLLSATGSRRSQGCIVWVGMAPAQHTSRRHDAEWVAVVRSASARRLRLIQGDASGEEAWRKAKERARRLRNRRPRA